MVVKLYKNDLPDGLDLGDVVAIDTETLGLNPHRDRLCLVQLSSGDGNAHLVQFERMNYEAPRLRSLLADASITKIFHFARFDVAVLQHYLGVKTQPLYCTKIASRLGRTYTDRHGLKDLAKDLLGVEVSKQQQSSDWGTHVLSDAQKQYAAQDVLYLHELRARLNMILVREKRDRLAQACFDFIPTRAALDLSGWGEQDVFSHTL